jgi:hypothetical protein
VCLFLNREALSLPRKAINIEETLFIFTLLELLAPAFMTI